MNYLAHIYLSGDNNSVKVGNFMADSVKGSNLSKYPAEIQKGITLHRFIDDFTDHSPLLIDVKHSMQQHFPKYYSLILDVYFDHYLARNWNDYSGTNLKAFVRNMYLQLVLHYRWLPPRARRSLPFLITQNWLESYKEISGIGMIFERMHRYRGLPWDSAPIINYLEQNYCEIEISFRKFFINIESKAVEKLASL